MKRMNLMATLQSMLNPYFHPFTAAPVKLFVDVEWYANAELLDRYIHGVHILGLSARFFLCMDKTEQTHTH